MGTFQKVLSDLQGLALHRLRQKDNEFITRIAGHDPVLSDDPLKQLRDMDQRLIAGEMPVRVVDPLEMVQV